MPELAVSSENQIDRSRAIDVSLEFPRVTDSVLRSLRTKMQRPAEFVPTPFPSVNMACMGTGAGFGFGQGDYILLAGPTGGGKSALSLNFAATALEAGIHTLFISLELSRDVLLNRLRSIVSGVDVLKLRLGDGFDVAAAERADSEILALEGNLLLNPVPISNIGDIAAGVGELVRSEGVKFVILDYVGLVMTSRHDSEMRGRMSEVSAKLAFMARTKGVTILVLGQYNRALAQGEQPHINCIFGSSSLGFDPDLVIGIDHSKYDRDPIHRISRFRLKTLKANHGPAVHFPVEFSTATLQFREVEYGRGEEES